MPLSCKGRVRGHQPNRGDIDECLGRYVTHYTVSLFSNDVIFL